MATRKQSPIKDSGPTYLTVLKEDAAHAIELQLTKSQKITDQLNEIRNDTSLEKAQQDYYSWTEYNEELRNYCKEFLVRESTQTNTGRWSLE